MNRRDRENQDGRPDDETLKQLFVDLCDGVDHALAGVSETDDREALDALLGETGYRRRPPDEPRPAHLTDEAGKQTAALHVAGSRKNMIRERVSSPATSRRLDLAPTAAAGAAAAVIIMSVFLAGPEMLGQDRTTPRAGRASSDYDRVAIVPTTAAADPWSRTFTLPMVLLFNADQTEFRPGGEAQLIRQLEPYLDGPVQAEVIGYTDQRGRTEYNQTLSERRAATVASALRNRGVSVTHHGEGESHAFCGDTTEKCREQNRRVEILLTSEVPK